MAEVNQFYEVLAAQIPVFIEKALDGAGSDLLTDLKARAFPSTASEGKDANGTPLKNGRAYSPAYAKQRQKKGLQTNYVDLQFTGNLLNNGIGVNRGKTSYIIDFANDAFAEQAADIERKYRQTIFAASKEEAEKALETFEFLFFGQVDKLTKQFGYR
jgi:hypothetical protein